MSSSTLLTKWQESLEVTQRVGHKQREAMHSTSREKEKVQFPVDTNSPHPRKHQLLSCKLSFPGHTKLIKCYIEIPQGSFAQLSEEHKKCVSKNGCLNLMLIFCLPLMNCLIDWMLLVFNQHWIWLMAPCLWLVKIVWVTLSPFLLLFGEGPINV